MTTIDCGVCALRPWRDGDVEALAAIANDADVARFLNADRFPHPYTPADAREWIALQKALPGAHYAIEVDGLLAGGIGVTPLAGQQRHAAHIGYWLGKAFWGRGIASAACRAVVERVFATTDLIRLETSVDAPNAASARVLEKCGFVREGVQRSAILKGGTLYDSLLYAKIREGTR